MFEIALTPDETTEMAMMRITEPKNGSWPQKAQNSHRKTNESNNRQIGEVVFNY